jgi:hypothetical protein
MLELKSHLGHLNRIENFGSSFWKDYASLGLFDGGTWHLICENALLFGDNWFELPDDNLGSRQEKLITTFLEGFFLLCQGACFW